MSIQLRRLLLVLIALKAALVAIDPTIRLYLGDSAAYLYGAMDDGRLPDDRSFTYSFLIRALVVPFGTLWALVGWQSLAGIGTALLLWWVLLNRFHVPAAVATAAACLLAVEPAQLYYERMVLAESFGLLWFAGFYAASAAYLATGRLRWMASAATLGLLAATFRLNYLPVVLVISVLLPFLRLAAARPTWRTGLVHVVLAIGIVTTLHVGYRQWVAAIFGSPPGYIARAGFMQLGLVAPLVRPEHLQRAGLPRNFEEELAAPLNDPDARMHHMWRPGGLVREMARRNYPVEPIARELSRMALADDPLGLVRLGVATLRNYFTPHGIAHALDNDLGRREIPADVLYSLREHWRYDARDLSRRDTIVSRYFEVGTWWLVGCLFVLAPLSIANAFAGWGTPNSLQALLAALFGVGLVLAHFLFVSVALYRYMHPLPFFVLLNAIGAAGALAGRRSAPRRTTSSTS